MESDERRKQSRAARFFLSPVIGLHKLTGAFLRKTLGDSGDVTEDVILSMVDAGSESGVIEDTSAEIISKAFEFDDLAVSDVMTHRVNVVGIESGDGLDDIIYLALDEGFSRLPVYRESVDDIIGIIIVKDLLSLIGKPDLSGFSIDDFLRETVFIPESCSCTDTFKILTGEKSGMGVVVDEYGGTAGIVTMEDLVEAVMGSIQDEYDEESAEIKKIGDEKYDVNGETDPEDVLKLFGYELPEDHEYETIAGFVTDLLGFIPEESGDGKSAPHADYKDVRFVAVGVEGNCISRIIAYRLKGNG
ncbi:MAG: hemolysin family protein [Oscillospiraceae bacterium]|jgi:putative hemolysin|nr:hemolysin family protein [Oscillospiraceae bacterium]